MAITSARMQMRRGLEADFDPNKMQPGEWAVSLDKKYVRMCFSVGVCVRMATYEAFEADMAEIQSIMAEARTIQEAVARIQTEINNTAIVVEDYAILSKSYAVGGTGTRIGEDTDNSKYYSELAKTESDKATTEADRAKTEADRAYSIVNIGIATTEKAGIVKPDGTTITVDADGTIHSVGGGGTAGTMDYEDLSNKPSVNGIELSGNKTTSDLGITAESVGADAVGSASTALSNAKDYTDTKIADLVGGAPATLDTLKEISDALTESREVVEAINQAIGNKIDKDGDSKDNTVTFTQANTRENILPTEKHSTLFGKIAKWFADLKTVAFSGSYNDLSDKPTIPTVNNATLTIQKNGNNVQTFTANASSDKTANIIVPTKTSELTNDSGFMSSATALDTYEEIMANTESGKFAGAKGVKEGFTQLNNSLGGFSFKTVDGKKQVSTDGGSTWSNFSSGAELLWTNPAPTSLFNAQTLSIDLSGYESVIIQAKGWYTVNTYTPLKIMIPKDGKPHLIIGNQADYTGKMGVYANIWYAREATLTNDSIIFGNGYVTGSNGAKNDACIPLEIYGTGLSLE